MKKGYLYPFIGLFCAFLLINVSMVYSRTINGKPVLSGTWRGKSGEYVGGEMLVKLKKGVNASQINDLLSDNNAYILRDFDNSWWGIVGCDVEANIFEKIEAFLENSLIEWAEPNMILYPASMPNDSFFIAYGKQWPLHNTGQTGGPVDADIDAPEAWDIEDGSPSCTIAVLDSGIPLDDNDSLEHEDLNDPDKFILGINTLDTTANLDDDVWGWSHGSYVIGIVGAMTDNDSTGIAGVCWDCRILVVKVGGLGWTPQSVSDGIRYAYQHGAKIINISGGSYDTSWSSLRLEDAVAEAESAGALIVAAVGNTDSSHVLWPAGFASWGRREGHENGYRNVIAVGGINNYNTRYSTSYSNDSLKITIVSFAAAWSTCAFSSNCYGGFGQTSAATPYVSGIAGLILSANPGLSPDSVRFIIEHTADDIMEPGWDDSSGYGRVNAWRALLPFPNFYDTLWSDTTWSDSMYVIGDIVVMDTVTLTIDSGTVVKFRVEDDKKSGVDTSKCELIIRGKLLAKGTNTSPVVFTSESSTPSDTDWYGIRILDTDSASAIIKYARIEYAYAGISYANSKTDTVAHCRFLNNGTYAIKTENSNLLITNNLIQDSSSTDTLIFGIYSDDASPTITNNEIRDCQYGIDIYKGAPSITSNKIVRGKVGLQVLSTNTITAKHNCFMGRFEEHYVKNSGSTLNLDSCYMAGESQDSTPIAIKYISSASGWIRRCGIYNYEDYGIYTGYDCPPNLYNGYNSIYSYINGNLTKAIKHQTKSRPPLLMDVANNWWGINPPGDSLFEGHVLWSPYLTSAPSIYDVCTGFGGGPKIVFIPSQIPEKFSLSQNYPNPFNPTTVVRFTVDGSQSTDNSPVPITLSIYNILGQKVKTLVNESKYPGIYEVVWDGKDEKGQKLASGIYFYRIKTDNFVESRKMLLLK